MGRGRKKQINSETRETAPTPLGAVSRCMCVASAFPTFLARFQSSDQGSPDPETPGRYIPWAQPGSCFSVSVGCVSMCTCACA